MQQFMPVADTFMLEHMLSELKHSVMLKKADYGPMPTDKSNVICFLTKHPVVFDKFFWQK